MYPGQALHLWILLFYCWSSSLIKPCPIKSAFLSSRSVQQFLSHINAVQGSLFYSCWENTLKWEQEYDVIQTVLKSQYWQWQPCSCLLSRIHLGGAHFALARLAGIIVSCGVLDPFLGKASRVAPSSPGRAPTPLVRWGKQKWGACVLLEFLWRIHCKHRLRNTNLSPPNAWSCLQIPASLCSPNTHTPGCWRDFIVQISCDLGTICVTRILSLQITFPSCVAPLKIPSVRKWQRKGPAKIQTNKFEVPNLTQTVRWRLLGSVRSSWERVGGHEEVHWYTLQLAVQPVPPRHGATMSCHHNRSYSCAGLQGYLLWISALLGQSNRAWWQTGASHVLEVPLWWYAWILGRNLLFSQLCLSRNQDLFRCVCFIKYSCVCISFFRKSYSYKKKKKKLFQRSVYLQTWSFCT